MTRSIPSRVAGFTMAASTVGALSGCTTSRDDATGYDVQSGAAYAQYPDSEAMAEAAPLIVEVQGPAEPSGATITAPSHNVTVLPDGTSTAPPVVMPVYWVHVRGVIKDDGGTVHEDARLRIAASVDEDMVPPASQESLLVAAEDLTLYLEPSSQDGVWTTLSPYQGVEAG